MSREKTETKTIEKTETKRRNQLLTRTVKEPRLAFARRWYEDAEFCQSFFDRCEDLALMAQPPALDLAHRALEMAHCNGDRHLMNRGLGVLAHAYLARGDLFFAGKYLAEYRKEGMDCCSPCRSDYLRRMGDLYGEQKKPKEALQALNLCLEEGGADIDADTFGRITFLRGIAHFRNGSHAQALDDAGHTLSELLLDSPRGFFHDSIALIAVYVGGGTADHDRLALEHVRAFDERIKGLKRWQDARTRIAWVAGHLHARLGEARRARRNLETAQRKLLKTGLPREAAAVTLDLSQLRCRAPEGYDSPIESSVRVARTEISTCLRQRDDLSEDHQKGLTEMERVLERFPEEAFEHLVDLRDVVVAPVPGRLSERVRKTARRR